MIRVMNYANARGEEAVVVVVLIHRVKFLVPGICENW